MSALSTLDDYIDDIAGTDTNSYLDANKHRAMTRWAHLITEEIIDAQGDWDFQGEIATADLVANQREYSFPADILKVKRIELKLDDSNWVKVKFLDSSEVSTELASESDITERFNNSEPWVELFDTGYRIYSGTIAAVTGGIKVWYSEEIVGIDDNGDDVASFSITVSTDTPNLAEFAQMGLVYGAILDYCETRDPELAQRMRLRLYGNPTGRPIESVGGLIGRIRKFYGNRAPDVHIAMTGASRLSNYD